MRYSSAMEGATTQWPERIWVVRHAQSAGNLARDYAEANNITLIKLEHRDADVLLSFLGQRQSQALSAWVTEVNVCNWSMWRAPPALSGRQDHRRDAGAGTLAASASTTPSLLPSAVPNRRLPDTCYSAKVMWPY